MERIIGPHHNGLAERIPHIVLIRLISGFLRKFPQNIACRHRIRICNIKGKNAFAAFAQTTHQDGLASCGAQQFFAFFNGRC